MQHALVGAGIGGADIRAGNAQLAVGGAGGGEVPGAEAVMAGKAGIALHAHRQQRGLLLAGDGDGAADALGHGNLNGIRGGEISLCGQPAQTDLLGDADKVAGSRGNHSLEGCGVAGNFLRRSLCGRVGGCGECREGTAEGQSQKQHQRNSFSHFFHKGAPFIQGKICGNSRRNFLFLRELQWGFTGYSDWITYLRNRRR